ncbi:MAG: redoxin domain-containing protein [Planctomycetes bacterium]|nr:redoxin domain-containing protein [Planctomycetota bacterium]
MRIESVAPETPSEKAKRDSRALESDPDAGTQAVSSAAIVGTLAPDFDLECVSTSKGRMRIRQGDYRGRWLVLVFYPRDFSLVCPTELTALSERLDEFAAQSADVLGVSVDSIDSHERWIMTPRSNGGLGRLGFPLASDEDGALSRLYGVYLEHQHVALRGLFIIDPNGVLQYQSVHNISVGRRTDGIMRILSALQTGGLCAEDWTPNMGTLDPIRELGPGRMLSHYRIEERLGTGAFGCVFRARDIALDRIVAVKVIRPVSPSTVTAVLNEARAAACLVHHNICTVFAVDDSEGIPFIAMEYIPGPTLDEMLDEAPLPAVQVANIGRQIAAGMAEAHAAGISHGDLKPANIVMRDDGVLKILDFGLARVGQTSLDTGATAIGQGIRGTPGYLSPEQARGEPASRHSDIFSLGVILYELLTASTAFSGESVAERLEKVRAVDPARFADAVAEPFATLIRGAMIPVPRERILTMREIVDSLQTVPRAAF